MPAVNAVTVTLKALPAVVEETDGDTLKCVVLIGLLIVLGVLLFFVGRSAGWWDSTKTLTIPTDVVGQPATAAKTELAQHGFTKVSTQPEVSTATPGDVVTTNPPPGSKVHSNNPVVLLVSLTLFFLFLTLRILESRRWK